MTKIQSISLFFRFFQTVILFFFIFVAPPVGFYFDWSLSLNWSVLGIFVVGFFFFITLIITFLEYDLTFKKKKYYFVLYLLLDVIMVCILFIYILFFHLTELYHLPLMFFTNNDLLFTLTLEILLGSFLLYHTYLKFIVDKLKGLQPAHFRLKFLGILMLMIFIIAISLILRESQDSFTRLYFIPAILLIATSSLGSVMAMEQNFGLFGSFKEKYFLKLRYEIFIYILAIITALGLIWGLIILSI